MDPTGLAIFCLLMGAFLTGWALCFMLLADATWAASPLDWTLCFVLGMWLSIVLTFMFAVVGMGVVVLFATLAFPVS